jgi:O-antigen/teichoic acid export membrane protein
MFASLGTASYGRREIARLREDKRFYSKAFWEIELIRVITTSICVLGWLLLICIYIEYRDYMLAMTFTLVAELFDISWLYEGLEKFRYNVGINSVFKLISLILVFVLVKTEDNLIEYMMIMSNCTLVGNMTMWLFLKKEVILAHIDIKSVKLHLRNTIIFFMPSIAISIYNVLDKTLIGIITKSSEENGYYEQATKIMSAINMVSFFAINNAITARASYWYAGNKRQELDKLIDLTYHITMFISVGALFGIVAVSNVFISVFLGEGYEPVTLLLIILSPITLVICISNVARTLYYEPANDMKKATVFLLCGSATNFILNLCLIPQYGSYGAAVATVVAEIIVTVLFVSFSNGYVRWKMIFGCLKWKVIAGMCMCMFVLCLNSKVNDLPDGALLILDVVCGAFVYVTMLLIMNDRSVEYIKKVVSRKKL